MLTVFLKDRSWFVKSLKKYDISKKFYKSRVKETGQ